MSGRTLEEFFDSLSPLETFEKEVFLGNEEYSQDLCDFILTLSLIWNDAKNISIFHDTVQKHRPSEEEFQNPSDMPITPEWGEFCGIYIFIEKSMVALIHELFSLIRKSKDILDDPVFQNILRQMHRGCRDSWNTIVEYVNGGANSKTQLGKALLMIRHKITSHYDKGEIFKGYHRKFIEDSWIPYISRGSSMPQQRFYFADAAAQEYYRSHLQSLSESEYYKNFHTIRQHLDNAIQNLVETFIQKRSSWRTPKLSC